MAVLLTRRRRAPPFGSQSPMTRRPASARIRRGCPFLTRVLVRAPIQLGRRHRRSGHLFMVSNAGRGGEKLSRTMCGERAACCPICPSRPPIFVSPLPSPLDTLVCNLSCGEGAATERRATEDCRPEPSKPLKSQPESLQEAGVVLLVPGDSPALPDDIDPHPFGLAGMVADADAREVEPSSVDAHERGGTLAVMGVAPALAESTASVELAGKAEGAIAAKAEALVPWAQDVAACEVEKLPQKASKANEPPPEALPQKGERNQARARASPERGKRERVWLSREVSCEALRQSGRKLMRRREWTGKEWPGTCMRRCHRRSNMNAVKRRKARPNMNPVGRRESRRARTSCPFGRNQALGILEGGRRGSTMSSRKGLLSHGHRTGHRRPQQNVAAGSSPAKQTWPLEVSVGRHQP